MQEKGPKSRLTEYLLSFLLDLIGIYILMRVFDLNFVQTILLPIALLFIFMGGFNLAQLAMADLVEPRGQR